MSARSEGLARKVEQANSDLLAAVEQSSDEQWRARCADGEWTQGYSGYHAANSIGSITGMVQGLATGQTLPPMTMADVDQGNAADAQEHAGCTKQEAIDLIRSNGPASVQMVRGLSDDQLDRKATLLTGMPEMSVEQVVEMLMVGHPTNHMQNILNAR